MAWDSLVPRSERGRRKSLVSTVCACGKSLWNSTGTVDIRLCLYTHDIAANNVVRTVNIVIELVACVTTACDCALSYVYALRWQGAPEARTATCD